MTKLTGKRVSIRDPKLSDVDALRYWQQPGRRWQDTNGPYLPQKTPEQVEESIAGLQQYIPKESKPEPRPRLIIADADDDTVLGDVTRYWITQETNWTSIGISIYDPENWNKGLGFEALGLWCQYLFDHQPDFVRLDMRTWSGNFGMLRLAEKLGFRKEAVFRMALIVNGEYYDSVGYGILRTEWDDLYPGGFASHL